MTDTDELDTPLSDDIDYGSSFSDTTNTSSSSSSNSDSDIDSDTDNNTLSI